MARSKTPKKDSEKKKKENRVTLKVSISTRYPDKVRDHLRSWRVNGFTLLQSGPDDLLNWNVQLVSRIEITFSKSEQVPGGAGGGRRIKTRALELIPPTELISTSTITYTHHRSPIGLFAHGTHSASRLASPQGRLHTAISNSLCDTTAWLWKFSLESNSNDTTAITL